MHDASVPILPLPAGWPPAGKLTVSTSHPGLFSHPPRGLGHARENTAPRRQAHHQHFALIPTVDTTTTQSGATPATAQLPLFSPTGATTGGLELLAAAATATTRATGGSDTLNPSPPLTKPGPFNPSAALPMKLVKRILDLDFVDMSEVTVDADEIPQGPGRPPAPARLPVTEISQWIERYSLMAAVLCSRFPDKAGELFAYQAAIVRAERNYEGKRWVTYDRQFRREALARKDLNWSVPDPRLYNEAFTGRARSIARCTYCLQDDHTAAYCPKNPNRPMFGWFPDPTLWHLQSQPGPSQPGPSYTSRSPQEICRRYNEGRCRHHKCKYRHVCQDCQGPHPWLECARNSARRPNRSRSPQQMPTRNIPNPPIPSPTPFRY